MNESNCQPLVHGIPDCTEISLMPDGRVICEKCGFSFRRINLHSAKLGEHLRLPSGLVRQVILTDAPEICPSCGASLSVSLLPCGEDSLSPTFSAWVGISDKIVEYEK